MSCNNVRIWVENVSNLPWPGWPADQSVTFGFNWNPASCFDAIPCSTKPIIRCPMARAGSIMLPWRIPCVQHRDMFITTRALYSERASFPCTLAWLIVGTISRNPRCLSKQELKEEKGTLVMVLVVGIRVKPFSAQVLTDVQQRLPLQEARPLLALLIKVILKPERATSSVRPYTIEYQRDLARDNKVERRLGSRMVVQFLGLPPNGIECFRATTSRVCLVPSVTSLWRCHFSHFGHCA